jgi:beta-phosphoglucomutase
LKSISPNTIRAIFFDLDGVLLDSMPWHVKAFNKILSDYSISVDSKDIAGKKTFQIFQNSLVNFDLSDSEIGELVIRKRSLMKGFYDDKLVQLTEDSIYETLYSLHNLFRLGICTSGSKNSLDYFFRISQSKRLFDLVLCDSDVKMGKPDPEIYLKAIEIFNLSSINCIVVEDSESGIIAARKAGCKVLAYNLVNESYLTSFVLKVSSFPEISRRIFELSEE